MENKIKTIKTKDWDLTNISSEYNLIDLLEQWKKALLGEASLRANALNSLENFKKWWFAYLKAESLDTKQRVLYKEFKKISKPTDEQKDFIQESESISSEISSAYEKLMPIYQMLNKNRRKVLKYLSADKTLAKYKVKIALDFLNKEGHDISEEDIKAKDATWGIEVLREIYNALLDDRDPDPIIDKDGKVVENIQTWIQVMQSKDENIRKSAFISWYTFERKHRTTLFTLSQYIAARLNQNANYYKYKDWIEQRVCEELLISYNDYFKIIDPCSKFKYCYYDYHSYKNSLIAKAYGLKKLEPWDADFRIQNTTDSISQAQAKQLIFDSLSCLGQDYVNRIKQCFEKNIVKWSKERSGQGYCLSGSSLIDEHPIYFEWDGTSISAGILAHELGHNINSKYIEENNEINKDHFGMFVEIPSIVNTLIYNLYLINYFKQHKAPKSYIYGVYDWLIGYLIDNICYSGYLFHLAIDGTYKLTREDWKPYDFEAWALNHKCKGCAMTETQYKQARKWPYWIQNLRCYREYINMALKRDVNISYYLGSIIALAIVPKIMSGDKVTLNKYLKFLKVGANINPLKILKETLGIDILRPQIYTEAKQQLEKLIKNFKKDVKI